MKWDEVTEAPRIEAELEAVFEITSGLLDSRPGFRPCGPASTIRKIGLSQGELAAG